MLGILKKRGKRVHKPNEGGEKKKIQKIIRASPRAWNCSNKGDVDGSEEEARGAGSQESRPLNTTDSGSE